MELGFKIYFAKKTAYISKALLKGETDGDTTVYKTKVDHVNVEWIHTKHEGGTLVDMKVSSDEPLGISRIDSIIVCADKPEATDHISVLGRETTKSEIRFPHEFAVDTEYCETAMGLYKTLDKNGLIVAGIAPFKNICKAVINKDESGNFTFSVKTEYTEGMLDYTELKTERAYINEDTTISHLFKVYRDLLPQSTFPMPKLVGWNTWDYYLDRVKAEDIFENVAALKDMPFASLLDYIVIDDGWQKGWGDWRENEKFACGLKAVADDIRKAGFIPGIWMTPVGIRDDVAIFKDHQDWLCRNEKGELLFSMGLYYLDPTHPEAKQFILDNYKYQYDAGYRLFKMDYVSPLLEVKNFYDKDASPYGVLAQLVEDVKAYTGPDAVVLGCSLPLECGADIAPSMRIGLDIHNHFPHVRAIARSISWSSIYNNKITRIDPDFLIVRGEETSNEPLIWEGNKRNDFYAPPRVKQTDKNRMKLIWRHGDQFDAIEAETWANLVAISGGNIFLSDRMSVLNERGIKIIENAFKIAGDSLEPVYLADDYRQPSLWKGDKAVVIVNWEEMPRTITVSGIDKKLTSDKPFIQKGDKVTVTLLPHESFAGLYK